MIGIKIGTIKNVQNELAKIRVRLRNTPPLFWPSKTPMTKKVIIETAAPKLIREIKAIGRSLKSPTVSRFTEKR